jgi:hypothetical protein
MMLKISHMAITRFAAIPNNAGASSIFKLLQARPALLQRRIKRQTAVAAAAAANSCSLNDSGNDSNRRRIDDGNNVAGKKASMLVSCEK